MLALSVISVRFVTGKCVEQKGDRTKANAGLLVEHCTGIF